jgi:hypothetical protein
MERSRRKQIVVPLIICMLALLTFFRTPGADSVRWVQILLLFAAGACAGAALAAGLGRRRDP